MTMVFKWGTDLLIILILAFLAPATAFGEMTSPEDEAWRELPEHQPKYQRVCGDRANEILKGFKKSLQKDLNEDCAYYRSVSNCLGGGTAVASCSKGAAKPRRCNEDEMKKLKKQLGIKEKEKEKKKDQKDKEKKKAEKQQDQKKKKRKVDKERMEKIKRQIARDRGVRSGRKGGADKAKSIYHDRATSAKRYGKALSKVDDNNLTSLLRYREKFKKYAKENTGLSDEKCLQALNDTSEPFRWASLIPGNELSRVQDECKAGLHSGKECKNLIKAARNQALIDGASNLVPGGKIAAGIFGVAAKVGSKFISKAATGAASKSGGSVAKNAAEESSFYKQLAGRQRSQKDIKVDMQNAEKKARQRANFVDTSQSEPKVILKNAKKAEVKPEAVPRGSSNVERIGGADVRVRHADGPDTRFGFDKGYLAEKVVNKNGGPGPRVKYRNLSSEQQSYAQDILKEVQRTRQSGQALSSSPMLQRLQVHDLRAKKGLNGWTSIDLRNPSGRFNDNRGRLRVLIKEKNGRLVYQIRDTHQ